MRIFFFLVPFLFLIFPAHAQVLGRPFALDPGVYQLECWSTSVEKVKEEIRHGHSYQSGRNRVSLVGDRVREELHFQNEAGDEVASMTRTSSSHYLPSGLYRQVFDNEAEGRKAHFEVDLEVSGAVNRFVSATWDGKPKDVAGRESVWQKMSDGRVVVQDYLISSLATWTEPLNLHAHTLCIFSPVK